MKTMLLALLMISTAFAQGPVAWYPFTSNTVDSSGNGYHLTNSNAILTADRFGSINSAYYFDGSDSMSVNIPGVPLGNSARSISAFIWMDDPGVNDGYIAGWGSGEGWYLNVYQDKYRLVNVDLFTSLSVHKRTWRHFAATFDGTTARIYVDGLEIASEAKSYNSTHSRFMIGSHANSVATGFQGAIDDVYLYARALSASEVDSLFRMKGFRWPSPSCRSPIWPMSCSFLALPGQPLRTRTCRSSITTSWPRIESESCERRKRKR